MIDRRGFLVGASSLAALTACSGGGGSGDGAPSTTTTGTSTTSTVAPTTTGAAPAAGGLAAPGSAGLVDESYFQTQIDSYLTYATASPRPASASGVAVQLAAARRDPSFTWDIGAVSVEGFADRWTQLDEWRDTRDFQFMYFNWLLAHGQGTTEMTRIDPAVIEAITQRVLANRYRYDDPLPADRVDHLWYWSENHRIITLSNELLAGQFFPDEVFEVTGMTGGEHWARARPEILDWIHERAEFGFFEWHSNVYMAKNVTPLLSLCELSDDDEIVNAAAMGLDLCLVDMAAHYHRGAYVAPHGRTYKKDKMTARDEDTFDLAKLLFDRTPGDHSSVDSTTATFFCLAEKYRPPAAVIAIAQSDEVSITRERHGIHVNSREPISDSPEAPFGYDFKDPANMAFWWSAGLIGVWQMAEVSTAEANEHRLWEGDVFTQIKQLSDVQGGDVEKIEQWLLDNYMILNLGGLDEANTYAWRSPQVSLASVLDHRKGQMRDQVQIWQATIDPDARVFTNHPMTGLPESTDWSDDGGDPGYWTGEASMPRTAQFERTAIHIYSPLWDETTDEILDLVFRYRDYTHAYFPQDHFDEVRQVGNWTLGARNGGYVALWSQRPATWRTYDPAVHATNGMSKPFDLVAEGGPDNVWIVEVGTEDDGTFDEFVTGVTADEPVVTGTGEVDVRWVSPSAGEMSFGWSAPFVVAGIDTPIADFPRHDSPWGIVERLETRHRLAAGDATLDLDFDAMTRALG
ncbi:MAG: hypothetical protein RIB98_16395 [Acidimicrobiales bacterium]